MIGNMPEGLRYIFLAPHRINNVLLFRRIEENRKNSKRNRQIVALNFRFVLAKIS